MTRPVRSRRPRGSLDAQRIVAAAFELAAQVGLDNLNMTELAVRLDVGVTSIYWHVRTKDDLLGRMAAQAVVRLDGLLPDPGLRPPGEWPDHLRDYFNRQREAFASDDLLTDLVTMRNARRDQESIDLGYRGVEATVGYLVAAGFSPNDAWDLYSALAQYTQGFAAADRRRRATGFPPVGRRQLALLDPAKTPIIADLVLDHGIAIDLTGDSAFRFGLEAMLAGAALLVLDQPQPASSGDELG